MGAFADYAYYRDVFHGTSISVSAFSRLAEAATLYVNYLCCERAAEIIEAGDDPEMVGRIKGAVCASVEALGRFYGLSDGEAIHRPLASESVGNHSVSYGKTAQEEAVSGMDEGRLVERTIRPYLAGTGLMYTGIDR